MARPCPRCDHFAPTSLPACPVCGWAPALRAIRYDERLDVPVEHADDEDELPDIVRLAEGDLRADDSEELAALFRAPLRRPVVVVPGIMGSRLFVAANGVWSGVWPPPIGGEVDLETMARLADILELRPGDSVFSDFAREQDGGFVACDERSLVAGAYEGLLRFLGKLGFHAHSDAERFPAPDYPNLLVFPYDWRQSCAHTGELLAATIERFLQRHNERGGTRWEEVDIVSHSLGGLVARAARLHTDRIRRIAFLAGPHLGTPKMFGMVAARSTSLAEMSTFAAGSYGLHPWMRSLLDRAPFLKDSALGRLEHVVASTKETLQSMASLYEMLPDKDFFANAPSPFAHERLFSTDAMDFRTSYFEPPTDVAVDPAKAAAALGGPPDGPHAGVVGFKERIREGTVGCRDLLLFSDKLDTPRVQKLCSRLPGFTKLSVVTQRAGDGSLVSVSGAAKGYGVGAETVGDVEHGLMPNDRRVHERLAWFLKEDA